MAQYALLYLRWKDFDINSGPTNYFEFKLNGTLHRFTRVDSNPDARQKQYTTAAQLKALVDSFSNGNYTTVSEVVELNDFTLGPYESHRVTITAKFYSDDFNFDFTGQSVSEGSVPSYTGTETVNIGNSAVITAVISNVICYNSATGSIVLTVSGGSAPYTYRWADGSIIAPITTKDRSNIGAGNYTVKVTDADGVETTRTFTVTQPTQINISANITNGNIELTVSGGVSPYTFEWSDGSTDQNRVGLEPGEYSVQVNDSNGCSKIATYLINEYSDTTGLFFSKNPVILRISAADPETKENLTFLCNVYMEDVWMSGDLKKIGVTQEQPGNEIGVTVFDLRDMLDTYLESHLPAYNLANMVRADKSFKRFYLEYYEKYGSPPEVQPVQQQTTNVVCFGGISDEEYARKYFEETYISSQKPFLTWEPPNKQVLPDQPEFLYYMNWFPSTTDINVRLKITYKDGSEFVTTVFSKSGLEQYEMYIIPAGYAQLIVAGYQAKEVDYYEIWVEDQANEIVSEVRTYTLAKKEYENVRYFLYENSLGGFNTLACTGLASKSMSVDEQLVSKTLPYDHAPEESNFEVSGKVGQNSIKAPIGNDLHPDYNERIQDFFMSERVYLCSNGRYKLVHIIARKVDLSDETENFTEKEFTYELQSFTRYTPDL